MTPTPQIASTPRSTRRFVDLKEMPGWNAAVPNGADSVSTGKVYTKVIDGIPYPYHIRFGALNKVTPEGIWRCLASHEGCWEVQA